MTGAQRFEVTVAAGEGGTRLDAWLARRLPELSRARLQALIDAGQVRLGDRVPRASERVREGQVAVVEVPAPEPAVPVAEDIAVPILWQDAHLLVVDKPAGLVVHPGAGHGTGTLVNALLHHVGDLSGVGGALRPGIVHRLDRDTSGLMVVAKDDATHRVLAAQFSGRTVEKEYAAVVHSVPVPASGRIDLPIGRDPVHRQRMSVRAPRGRAARTRYTVAERLDGASLLAVHIETGRTHQIRVHLASARHPIVGDEVYGGRRTPSSQSAAARAAIAAFPRPALHAARLAFDHPQGQRLQFESPLPADFAALLLALRG